MVVLEYLLDGLSDVGLVVCTKFESVSKMENH